MKGLPARVVRAKLLTPVARTQGLAERAYVGARRPSTANEASHVEKQKKKGKKKKKQKKKN